MKNELYHHGVKGMKWGIRKQSLSNVKRRIKSKMNDQETKRKIKKAAKIGAGVAIAGLAIYGGYKLYHSKKQYDSIVALGKKMRNMQERNDKVYLNMMASASNSFRSGDGSLGRKLMSESTDYGTSAVNYKKAADILDKAAKNTAYYKVMSRRR